MAYENSHVFEESEHKCLNADIQTLIFRRYPSTGTHRPTLVPSERRIPQQYPLRVFSCQQDFWRNTFHQSASEWFFVQREEDREAASPKLSFRQRRFVLAVFSGGGRVAGERQFSAHPTVSNQRLKFSPHIFPAVYFSAC